MLAVFYKEGTGIVFENPYSEATNIILFGSQPYSDPIASHGPFVMNNIEEIYQANRNFKAGKYGKIA